MVRVIRLGALVALVFLLTAGAARAEDPLFLGWTTLAPALTTEYDPSSENDCAAGRTRCVDAVIREMERRFRPLAGSCDHDAIFSLTYLRTTEEYRRAIEDPGFFEDTRFVNHEDVVFARYYFEAYDDWSAGRLSAVPQAWAIAFRAADQRAVSAAGNVVLGINAHVQRDLPFVLAAIGMVKPRGGRPLPGDSAPLRPDDRRQRAARDGRQLRRVSGHPDLAGDRLAQRRAAGVRAERGSASAGRRRDRGVRRVPGRNAPGLVPVRAAGQQRCARCLLRRASR